MNNINGLEKLKNVVFDDVYIKRKSENLLHIVKQLYIL